MSVKSSFKTVGVRLAKISLRVLVYITSTALLWFAIVMLDRIAIPLFIHTSSDEYSHQVSVPAMIIFVFITSALFKKIVMKKSVRTPITILLIYLTLLAVDLVLVLSGFDSLPGEFWLICLVGLIGYFLIRPFKKTMVAKEGKANEI